METTFDFEELQLPEFGEGILFYGQATLSDDQGETDHFIVTDIRLAGGKWLSKPGRDASTLSQKLFRAIEDVLYDDKTTMGRHAAMEWADFVSGEAPVVPMFRRRSGLTSIVQGADMQGRGI